MYSSLYYLHYNGYNMKLIDESKYFQTNSYYNLGFVYKFLHYQIKLLILLLDFINADLPQRKLDDEHFSLSI